MCYRSCFFFILWYLIICHPVTNLYSYSSVVVCYLKKKTDPVCCLYFLSCYIAQFFTLWFNHQSNRSVLRLTFNENKISLTLFISFLTIIFHGKYIKDFLIFLSLFCYKCWSIGKKQN